MGFVAQGTHSMEQGEARSFQSSAFRAQSRAFEQAASESGASALAGMDSGFCTTDSEMMLSDCDGTAIGELVSLAFVVLPFWLTLFLVFLTFWVVFQNDF